MVADYIVDRRITVALIAATVNRAVNMKGLVLESIAVISQMNVAVLTFRLSRTVMDIAGIRSRRRHGMTLGAVVRPVAGKERHIPDRIGPLNGSGDTGIRTGRIV